MYVHVEVGLTTRGCKMVCKYSETNTWGKTNNRFNKKIYEEHVTSSYGLLSVDKPRSTDMCPQKGRIRWNIQQF